MALTTYALVQEELGVTFTGAQQTQCTALIADVAALIARRVRDYEAASPATEILTVPAGGVLYLKNRPVTAITSVSVRSPAIGADGTALVADTSYELLDAANGILRVAAYPSWDIITGDVAPGALATVVYTHTSAAALDLKRAATLKVAAWMEPRLLGTSTGLAGVEKVSFGQDLSLSFGGKSATEREAEADRIIASYAGLVFA